MRSLRRTPALDELAGPEGMLVLLPGQLVSLSPLGATIVDIMGDDTITMDALAAALAERFGEPDTCTVAEATQSAVDSLLGQNVLETCWR